MGSIFGSLALGPLSWWIAVDVRRSILEIPKQARALNFLWGYTGALWFLSVVGLLSGVL